MDQNLEGDPCKTYTKSAFLEVRDVTSLQVITATTITNGKLWWEIALSPSFLAMGIGKPPDYRRWDEYDFQIEYQSYSDRIYLIPFKGPAVGLGQNQFPRCSNWLILGHGECDAHSRMADGQNFQDPNGAFECSICMK